LPNVPTRRRGLFWFGAAALLVLAIAQLVSYLVQARFAPNESRAIGSMLHLTYIQNNGIVFGWFPGTSLALALAGAVLAVGGCLFLLRSSTKRYQFVCLGLIVGAAASNIADRLVYGAVIDYIDVRGIPYWHYVFNIADVMIHAGAWPLALGAVLSDMRAPRHADDRGAGIDGTEHE
jgi:signal peptidase II